MAAKRTKPKVGDVFRIPISEQECGFGQILAVFERAAPLMVVFSRRSRCDECPSLDEIVSSAPLFVAISFDVLIQHGDWPIVGNRSPDLVRFPLPKYRVDTGSGEYVETFDMKRSRPATQEELRKLKSRSLVAPIRLENALKAHWGFGKWDPDFDHLKAEIALQSASIELCDTTRLPNLAAPEVQKAPESQQMAPMAEHAVLLFINLSDDEFGTEEERERVRALSHELAEAVKASEVGEFDGDEFGAGRCELFMYGPDADRLFSVIEPILRRSSQVTGGYAIKRFGAAGDPDVIEKRVQF